jgi:hypothetical protein
VDNYTGDDRPSMQTLQIPLLGRILDRSRAGRSHLDHGIVRSMPALDQEPGGDGAGAPQSALAVDHDLSALAQQPMDCGRCLLPAPLPGVVRHGHVGDRQVVPLHAQGPDALPQSLDGELCKLVVFDEGDDRGRAPGPDRLEVGLQVTGPPACHRIVLALSGAEGDADPSTIGQIDRADLQGMTFTGAHFAHA